MYTRSALVTEGPQVEAIAADAMLTTSAITAICRYDSLINTACRLVYRGEAYGITSVSDWTGTKFWMQIQATKAI